MRERERVRMGREKWGERVQECGKSEVTRVGREIGCKSWERERWSESGEREVLRVGRGGG